MRRRAAAACVVLAGAVVALAEQAPEKPRPAGDMPAPAGAPADGKTVTVAGCLHAGASANSFVLAGVKWEDPAGAGTRVSGHHAADAGGEPEPFTVGGALTLRLAGTPAGVSLGDHVGRVVSVTGMLVRGSPPERPAVGTSGDTAPPAGDRAPKPRTPGERASEAAAAHTLNVRTIQRLAGSCPTAGDRDPR